MHNFDKEIITTTFEETQKLGEDFAQELVPGDVVLLYGDLGSGKTTFTQGLAKGLGIKKRIISPTFTIVRTYKCHPGGQRPIGSHTKDSIATLQNDYAQSAKVFYHIDLYRTESVKDLKGIGIEEILNDKEAVVVIEWPEKLGKLLPKNRYDIHFSYEREQVRKINIIKK